MSTDTVASSAAASNARRILLHVVSPSEEAKRLTFPETPLSITIGELKLKIRDVVPSKPLPERQRLIYQGRPLTVSSATLASVFGQEASLSSDSFTLHLVLPLTGSRPEATSRSGTPPVASPYDPARAAASDAAIQRSGTPGSVHSATGAGNNVDSHLPRIGVEESTSVGGAYPGQHLGQDANPPVGQPQAAHRILPHPGGHTVPPGMTTGFNPFPQYPQQHPTMGNPFAMNEHMRRVFAEHMQQHEGLRRNMAGHNSSNNPSQSQNGSAQQGSNGAVPGQSNAAPESRNEAAPNQQNNGTTVVQEGHGPNGQWRVVMNQTTVPFTQGHGPTMGLNMQPPPYANVQTSTHAAPSHSVQAFAPQMNAFPMRLHPGLPFPNLIRQPTYQLTSSFPPMVYLLSSPTGYQAILLPPGASQPPVQAASSNPTSTLHQQAQQPTRTADTEVAPNIPNDNNQQPEEQPAQPAGQQGDAVDIFRIVFPLGGHLWLLIRLLGLVYLITGGATWTRTILLSSLALVVFIAQAGWLNPIYQQVAEPLRRHLEGVVGVGQPVAGAQPQAARPQDQQEAQQQAQGQARAGATRDTAGPGVTPEQLAARLIREHEERDPSVIRATMRRFERSLALFIASLVPGVGEGHVQAQQEAEIERQREEQEREVAERRREEEERANAGQSAAVSSEPQADMETDPSASVPAGEEEPLLAEMH